jgi:hypothetical protein
MEADYQIEMLDTLPVWVKPDRKERLHAGKKYWVTKDVVDALKNGRHCKVLQAPAGKQESRRAEEIDLSKPMFQAVDAKTGEDVTEKLAKKPPKAGKRRGRPSGRKPGRPPKTAAPQPAETEEPAEIGGGPGTVTGFKGV